MNVETQYMVLLRNVDSSRLLAEMSASERVLFAYGFKNYKLVKSETLPLTFCYRNELLMMRLR